METTLAGYRPYFWKKRGARLEELRELSKYLGDLLTVNFSPDLGNKHDSGEGRVTYS